MSTNGGRLWWLYGPPCAGKSVTAWQLHVDLVGDGPRAYFDVDQVGICYPEPADDPDRYALKARAAAALVRRLTGAGVRTVVVSGVLDRPSMTSLTAAVTTGTAVTFCRVRVDRDELTRRLQARYDPPTVRRALVEAQAWDEFDDGHPVVDTSTGTPSEVARRARRLLESTGPTAVASAPDRAAETPAPAASGASRDRPVALLLCGPTGVGTSTAGFSTFTASLATGRPSSYLDLQQLGFRDGLPASAEDPAGHRLTAACVADVWERHRAVGSRTLVLTGHVETADDVAHHRAALGDTPLLVCRLQAGRAALRERITERARGRGPHLAGDALAGMDEEQVEEVVERALAQQARLRAAEFADAVVDTDALDADSVARRLLSLLTSAVTQVDVVAGGAPPRGRGTSRRDGSAS